MENKKYYVFRVHKKTGRKEYKLRKTLDYWVSAMSKARKECWQFSRQGALGIVKHKQASYFGEYYEFGIEEVE